jgi:hypothetical protein
MRVRPCECFHGGLLGSLSTASNDDKQARLVQLRAIIGQVRNWLRAVDLTWSKNAVHPMGCRPPW